MYASLLNSTIAKKLKDTHAITRAYAVGVGLACHTAKSMPLSTAQDPGKIPEGDDQR